jgi:PAS domain S-box-containing protein
MFLVERSEMYLVFVGVATLSLAILGISRARQNLLLQRQIVEGQKLEIALKQKALDEHSLAVESDTNGIILAANQKFLDAFKYRREELIGRPFRDFYFEDDVPISHEIQKATPSGRIWTGETRLKRGDGSVAITQTTVVPLIDKDGKHVKNLSLREDITKFRAEKNEKTITSAFDEMLDAVVMHDPSTSKILYMNSFALADHGWTAEEAETRTVWDTDYIPDRDDMAGLCEKIQEDGKFTLLLENSKHGNAYEASSYLIGVEGGDRRVLTIFRNMTESVKTERERNRLVSVITHELRTPLTSIKGSLGLLDAGSMGPMSIEAKSLVNIALRNSDRMLGLIRDILSAERTDQTTDKKPITTVNLSELIDTAIASNQGYGAQFGIDFVNLGTAKNLKVKGNSDYIEQILANLMSNAAKFSPNDEVVEIWATQEGSTAVLHVRDFGDGIPEDLQPRLFERFTKTKQPQREGVHGSGLGLSIVKSLVERLDGTMDYETVPGKGTCFHIGLPLAVSEPIHQEDAAATA